MTGRGKRVRPNRSDSFESEVHRQFGPMAASFGLHGPIEDGVVLPTVAYRMDRLSYTWMLDAQHHALAVDVSLEIADGSLSITVDDLVVAAGLGAAQDVRTSAQTWHSLQRSIASHVHWLEQLHGHLTGPEADQFLRRCGARKHTPDLD
jgi:hypothetical protein